MRRGGSWVIGYFNGCANFWPKVQNVSEISLQNIEMFIFTTNGSKYPMFKTSGPIFIGVE